MGTRPPSPPRPRPPHAVLDVTWWLHCLQSEVADDRVLADVCGADHPVGGLPVRLRVRRGLQRLLSGDLLRCLLGQV